MNKHLRTPTPADLEAVVALENTAFRADIGRANQNVMQLRSVWFGPSQDTSRDLGNDYAVMEDERGQLIAYMESDPFDPDEEPGLFLLKLVLHPDYRTADAFDALLTEGVRRAQAWGATQSADVPLRVVVDAFEEETFKREQLARHGFAPERWHKRMEITMEAPPPAPVWPDGITGRAYQLGDDDRAVWEAWRAALLSDWMTIDLTFEQFMYYKVEREEDFDPALWTLAVEGETIAGFVLSRLERPGDPDTGHIRDVGVVPAYRRRGVGLALLHANFAEFYQRGKRRVSLGVDGMNQFSAGDLYEKAGMRPVLVMHSYFLTIA